MTLTPKHKAPLEMLLRWVISLGESAEAALVVRDSYPTIEFDDEIGSADRVALSLTSCASTDLDIENSYEQALVYVAHRISEINYLRHSVELDDDERIHGLKLLESCLDRITHFDSLDLVQAQLKDTIGLILQSSEPERAVNCFGTACELRRIRCDPSDLTEIRRWANSAYNMGLSNLDLHRLSHSEHALRIAFNLRSELYRQNRSTESKADLALVHDALGQLRQDEHRLSDAVRHHRRSVITLRELTQQDQERWIDCLAGALNNLGQALCESDRPEEAVLVQEEVLTLYQSLTGLNSDYYSSDLAMAWHNLGQSHGDIGTFEKAETMLGEAHRIRSTLAVSGELEPKDNLAQTLDALGTLYTEHQQFDKAKLLLEQAFNLRRDLANTHPGLYTHDLCRTMVNLGNLMVDVNNTDKAVHLYEDSEQLYLALATQDATTQAALATIRMNASALYRELGRFDDARGSAIAACKTFRAFIDDGEIYFRVSLATALNNLGLVEHEIRQVPAARKTYMESLALTRVLVAENHQRYLPDLGRIQLNIASLFRSIGDLEQARTAAFEAHKVYQELADVDPGRFEVDLGNSAMNLGIIALELDEWSLAEKTFDQALSIHERMAIQDEASNSPMLARTFLNLFSLYAEQDRAEHAELTLKRSIDLYNKLSVNPNSPYLADLALVYANAGVWFERCGKDEIATKHYRRSVNLCERSVGSDYAFVAKGDITVAYRRLLAAHIDDAPKALSYAAALLDPDFRSGIVDADALKSLQQVMATASKQFGSEHLLLIPITDIADEKLSLGLITGKEATWFSINCAGWAALAKPTRNASDVKRLETLSQSVWNDLPVQVQHAINGKASNGGTILISADPSWSVFPWEIIRHRSGPDGYLGLDHALARVESVTVDSLRAVLHCRSLGTVEQRSAIFSAEQSGENVLEAAQEEARAAHDTLVQQGGKPVAYFTGQDADIHRFREALLTDPDLVYFCGHGDVVDSEELLVLGTSPEDPPGLFGTYELEQLAAKKPQTTLFSNTPLIVLSSCLTGNRRQFGGHREDLAGRFLFHGAGAVIATALPIDDNVVGRFGTTLLNNEGSSGCTISARVLKARRELALDSSLVQNSRVWGAWARIHLHGAPHSQLFG